MIGLIYAGGTFGSHGTPLSPLSKAEFLPILLGEFSHIELTPLDINLVKDSSTLTPSDFLVFYHAIKAAHQAGLTRFLLITGTDTLSYLSAFLHYALGDLPISVIVTGSMYPFLRQDCHKINPNSDAQANLLEGLAFLQDEPPVGVFVSFYHQIFYGNRIQKINAHDPQAFVGTTLNTPITRIRHSTPTLIQQPCVIHSVFALPNEPISLAYRLNALQDLPPTAVLVIGFGAGNLSDDIHIRTALTNLYNKGFLLIMTSQCPFGERSTSYAAGAWQYEIGMLSDNNLPISALYAKALWLCLAYPPHERATAWQQTLD